MLAKSVMVSFNQSYSLIIDILLFPDSIEDTRSFKILSLVKTNVKFANLSVSSNPLSGNIRFPIKLKDTLSLFHLFSLERKAEIAISK